MTLLHVWSFARLTRLLRPLLTSHSSSYCRPFGHEAGYPQVRTHSFIAQPPDLHRFALITRASWLLAHSPCSAVPSIRFLFIGSQFTLHASFPHSVTLMQLRFTSFVVTNPRRNLHPQECAHAGRSNEKAAQMRRLVSTRQLGVYLSALKRTRLGRAPSSPRRFFLSASYSW